MVHEEPSTERKEVQLRMNSNDGEYTQNFKSIRREVLDEYAEKYGFPSRSAFMRAMIELGISTLEYSDPRERDSDSTSEEQGVTVRELVPEGEENAVDMTNEFWEEILRDKMLDIVEQDPEINRNGYQIYK